MTKLRTLRCAAVMLAFTGLVTPRCMLRAGEPPTRKAVADVVLTQDGGLAGQVISDQGDPLDGVFVTLSRQGKPMARTTTNSQGQFTLASVKGGMYELKAGPTARAVRVWKSDAAPPAANENATLVVNATVRAQDGYSEPVYDVGGLDFISLGTLATSAGALAVSIVNQTDLNELQDKVDDLSSP